MSQEHNEEMQDQSINEESMEYSGDELTDMERVEKERDDFRYYINTNKSFTRDNLFMCKSKKILNLYYKSIFSWLNRCENIFGFNLQKWHQIRIYGFLAERYVGYWFKKYTNSIEWPIIFFDTHKNKVKF